MKRLVLVALILSLLAGVAYYFFTRQRTRDKIESIAYNRLTGQWERIQAETNGIDPTTIILPENHDGLSNTTIIRGYFQAYDGDTQTLQMRKTIPLSRNALFEEVALKLTPYQSIYCVPSHYTDPNTGKTHPMDKLVVPVADGATLFMPNESAIAFSDFIESSTDLTFLLAQLTQAWNPDQTNYVQKIIVTGLCE